VLTAVLATFLFAAPPSPPTPAALSRALHATAQAWVQVQGAHGKTGPGLVVGRGGEVLTPVRFVSLDHAQVHAGRQKSRARVLAASAYLGTAIVRPEKAMAVQAVAVRPDLHLAMGGWLIAVDRRHKDRPRAVRILTAPEQSPFFQLADNLPDGTALLDSDGALVAFVIRHQAASSTAVRVSAIRTQLASTPVHAP
jgi:hypothetical protein